MRSKPAEDYYYQYDPLPERHIRVVKVFACPQERDWDIPVIGLSTLRLDDNAGYNTLSYTWGPPILHEIVHDDVFTTESRCYPVLCEGRIIRVTRNLIDALKMLREMQGPDAESPQSIDFSLPIWIDAICINQDDLDERTRQVAIMGTIYEVCQVSIAWLGPEDEHLQSAIELMNSIFKLPSHYLDEEHNLRETVNTSEWQYFRQILTDADKIPKIASMAVFMRRLWFERSWVMQEILLSPSLVMVCGRAFIPFSSYSTIALRLVVIQHFWDIGAFLDSYIEFRPDLAVYHSRNARIAKYTGKVTVRSTMFPRLILLDAMSRHRKAGKPVSFVSGHRLIFETDCSEPRDAIYAFYGIFYEFRDAPPEVRPDYTLPMEDVYTNTWAYIIRLYQNLDIFDNSFQDPSKFKRNPSLPTWCPDLRSGTLSTAALQQNAAADDEVPILMTTTGTCCSKDLKFEFELKNTKPKSIHLRGVFFSSVDSIVDPETCFSNHSPLECTEIINFLIKVALAGSQNRDAESGILTRMAEPSVRPDQVIKMFWETILTTNTDHRLGVDTRLTEVYHILCWLQGNKSPHFGGLSSLPKELFLCTKRWQTQTAAQESLVNLPGTGNKKMFVDDAVVEKFIASSGLSADDGKYKFQQHDIMSILDIIWRKVRNPASQAENMSLDREFENTFHLFRRRMLQKIHSRYVFGTSNGFIGVGSQSIQKGDEVWILAGGTAPFVLRPQGDGTYNYFGPCWVHGIMYGEAVSAETETQEVIIQ